jgi:hypothetical protein
MVEPKYTSFQPQTPTFNMMNYYFQQSYDSYNSNVRNIRAVFSLFSSSDTSVILTNRIVWHRTAALRVNIPECQDKPMHSFAGVRDVGRFWVIYILPWHFNRASFVPLAHMFSAP